MPSIFIQTNVLISFYRRAADHSDDESNGNISKSIVSRPRKVQKRAPIVDLTAEDDENMPAVVPAPLPRVASTSVAPTAPTKPSPTTAAPRHDTDTPVARPMAASAPIPPSKASGTAATPRTAPQQQAESQRKRHAAEAKERMQAAAKREEEQKACAAERRKDLNRDRQQRFRDRKKASGDSMAKKTKNIVLNVQKQTVAADVNVAEVSRPSGQKWKAGRTGKKNGVIQKRHQRVNWYHPFLWSSIDSIAPRVGWSPTMIVASLQRQNPQMYGRLNKGTVQKWISKNRRDWSTKTKKNVARRHALAGTGRVGVLSPYPELVATIKTKLQDLRASGVCVGRLLTRSIIIAIIKEKQPELLANFKCTAAKLPDNVDEVCMRAFFRIVHLVNFYDIPPELIVNMDQTGVMLMVANNKTYNPKGSRQLDIHGRDEKRAYSLLVGSTPKGKLLTFQQVWSGKTKASLPRDNAPGMAAAKKYRFHFAFAESKKTTSHFSTLKTMKEWVHYVLVPYIEGQIQLLGLEPDQKAILYSDVYPVHTGIEFRTFILEEFPNIFLVFVPANCTSVLQPADIGLNRVFKHHIKQAYLDWMVAAHTEQLKNGLTVEQVKFTTSLPVLRDASVKPIVDLYEWGQTQTSQDLIKRAWEKCIVGEFNLGAECLTSKKIKAAYRQYLLQNPDFRKEIEDKIGNVLGLDDDMVAAGVEIKAREVAAMGTDDVFTDEVNTDPTDIPLHSVVQAALQLEIPTTQLPAAGNFCVSSDTVRADDNGILAGSGDIENIWAYNDNGCPWSKGNLADETFEQS
ncbi:DDE superfamily protein [Mycena venus]|uniref:DDE superfamily protein n=1 Tax=Mycena venus TaxID=2733690 RepID=A0A8H6Z7I5_9AGAR|nr:DDE superfamily protein [Mycena venus]